MNKNLLKKKDQLGMNPSTASHKLVKDILWSLVVKTGQDYCHRCSEKMVRDNFSIEHIEDWLDSKDPVGLYFSLDNITFSHLSCNVAASRPREVKSKCGSVTKYVSGCRCEACKKAKAIYRKEKYCKEKRRQCYISNGT